MSATKNEELEKYMVVKASPAERSDTLIKLMGWFRAVPDSEFWVALEQLTMLERAAEDVDVLLPILNAKRGPTRV